MRFHFLTLLLVITYLSSSAQKGDKYNTTINKAYKVQIEGNKQKVIIQEAGNVSIEKVIIVTAPQLQIFLTNYIQTKDSLGNYITKFKFGNDGSVNLVGVDVTLRFSEQVEKPTYKVLPPPGEMGVVKDFGVGGDSKKFNFSVPQLKRGSIIEVIVKSKGPISTTIEGISGTL